MARSSTRSRKTPVVPRQRTCGTMQVHHRLLEQYPEFRLRQGQLEHATAARVASGVARKGTVTIPVVVHVVYNAASENISTAQVTSQIDALNRDYAARNTDRKKVPAVWKGLVSDTRIQFALATRDPLGKATDGINRVKTTRTSFIDDNQVKSSKTGGAKAWPARKYLNLWVCSLGNDLLGYAQFPGGPAATDGVVILNLAFGTKGTATAPFNLGRTAVHEVGHWLNLHHIWGDTADCTGSDFVADTPHAQHPNFHKPKFPHISCGNGPSGDMFMNYMDYVDDDSMVMFSAGQVARMQATLDAARSTIGV